MKLWLRMLARDLTRLRGRLFTVAIASLLGVALFAASYGSYRNLVASYDAMFERTAMADLTVKGGDVDVFATQARADPAVAAVSTRTVIESYARIGDRRLLARIVGRPAGERPAVNRVMVLAGSRLDAAEPESVLVERHLAEHHGLVPGDALEVRTAFGWQRVTVAGVVASPEYLWPARSRQQVLTSPANFGVLFTAQGPLEALAGGRGRQALVLLKDRAQEGAARDAALERLTALAREHGATDTVPLSEQPSNAILHEDIQGFREMAILFPVLFLAAAALAAFVVLGRLVHTRRWLIGTLRASGVRRRAVLGYHLAIGLVPTVGAAVLGAVAGEGLAGVISRLYTSQLSIPITVIQAHPLVDLAGVAMALLAVTVATLAPALDAARVTPSRAMGGAAPSRQGGRLQRWLPAGVRLPASLKLVLRGALRTPGRSLVTIAGVALSLVLVLVALGMLDTAQVLLDRQFQHVQTQDAEVYLADGAGAEVRQAVRDVSGVTKAEPVLATPVAVAGPDGSYATQLRAFEPGTTMHAFLGPGGDPVPLPEDGVLLDFALRDRLGIEVGDDVPLTLSDLDREVARRVAGFVDEPLGAFAYASLPFEAGGAVVPTNALYVDYAAGVDRGDVRTRLSDVDQVVAVVDARTVARAVDDLMGLFYLLVGIMLIFGGVLAFALIFATMSVTIAERASELATLRAAGVRRGQIARIVGGESLMLVLVGLAPGMLVAWLVADRFLATFSSDMFRFDLQVRPLTWAAAAAAVIVAALVSELPALRAVERIDLAEAVRERGC